jgi:hypothetical protein
MTAKMLALSVTDKEMGRTRGISQFLDEKSYRPGRETYSRDGAAEAPGRV